MAKLLMKCKLCRREGVKLFLKGQRCDTVKCAVEKGAKSPGQHGAKKPRFTDYGKHLREKQKLKRLYGLSERQLKRCFAEAMRQTGNTGENLLVMLETRLDNVLYMGGFAPSRTAARQLITHGHITLNGHKASIASLGVHAGNIIKPASNETSANIIKKHRETVKTDLTPSWLKLTPESLELSVVQMPKRTDITSPINEQMVIEFCSR